MHAKKLPDIRTNYTFEAPVLPADVKQAARSAQDLVTSSIDLSRFLIPDPRSAFLVRVSGESMIDKNIYDGDILIVSRSEQPANGKVVVAALNGEMAVKTFRIIDGEYYLYSANQRFLPIRILPFMEFSIQGVVKHVIHNV